MTRTPDETPDIELADELIFRLRQLVLEPFTREEMARGKTPDRRVLQGCNLVAFSEIKSPRDDWLDEQLDAGRPAQKSAVVGQIPSSIGLHATFRQPPVNSML